MPGIINIDKKASGQMRPDWTLIGYNDCPQTTLDGHAYAVDIVNNWDPTITTGYQKFYNDYKIMYFPKNVDTSNITTMNQMFLGSNLEDIEIDCSGVTAANGLQEMFRNCNNLRHVKLKNLKGYQNSTITNLRDMFNGCQALEEIEFTVNPSSTDLGDCESIREMQAFCLNCYSLKNFKFTVPNSYGAALNMSSAFNNCSRLENLQVEGRRIYELGAAYSGLNTTGCLYTISMNDDFYESHKAKLDLSHSYIKAGSYIMVNYLDPANKAVNFSHCRISEDNNSRIHLTKASDSEISGYAMFEYCTFTTPISHIHIDSLSTCEFMFWFTNFYSNSTLDLSHIDMFNSTNFHMMFRNSNIKTIIGFFDFSAATNFENMFMDANYLDDNTINNLLASLAVANSGYTGTKTLEHLGFNSGYYPASRIQALSNYSTFTNAGWTIGY